MDEYLNKTDRERSLINRCIWCDLMKTHKKIIDCKPCIYRENCQYREHGAMRKVNVTFDNWITK